MPHLLIGPASCVSRIPGRGRNFLDTLIDLAHHEADFLRRTSYPTSGYSLGTRGRRSSRRLVAPPGRRTPVIRLAIVALALLLGSRAFGILQAHRDLHPVAATARTGTPHPAVASRPAASAHRAPTATPSPSRPPLPSQLPQVKVPVLSASWLRTHPIAEVPSIKGRAAIAMGITDRAAFINFMNQKAVALHLRATHFTNPSGLDETDHYSSAYDLAVMGATLLADYPDLRADVGPKQISIYATPQHKAFNPINIDRLLSTYVGAIGIKPGYTGAAGYCLAAAATRNGRTILVVVLGSTQHFTDATTLLDFGFRHPVTH